MTDIILHRDNLTTLLGKEMSPLISGCVDRYSKHTNGVEPTTAMLQSIMDAINAVAARYGQVDQAQANDIAVIIRWLKLAYMGARVMSTRRGSLS